MSVYSGKRLLHTAFFLLVAPGFLSCSTFLSTDFEQEIQKRKVDLKSVENGSGPKLSEALSKNLSNQAANAERKSLLNLITQKSNDKNYQQCVARFKGVAECEYLKPNWNQNFFIDDPEEIEEDRDLAKENDKEEVAIKILTVAKGFKSKGGRSKIVFEIAQNLRSGNLTPHPQQIEGDYYRALKSFQSWTPELQSLANRLIKEDPCYSEEIYYYLGMKGEEFFPNEELFSVVLSLYDKADSCGSKNSSLIPSRYLLSARFRLGLLYVMKEDCDRAQKVFNRLSRMSVSDYSSRALYWSAYCSKTEFRKGDFLSKYDQLFKINPLGFHTLSLTRGNSVLDRNLKKTVDPNVQVRTASNVQFNSWIQAIEDLDRIRSVQGVRKLLSPVRISPEYLSALEPEVRLYLATFAFRSGDSFSLFRILDSVFRSQSEYVLEPTLKLFYPLKHLESISKKVTRVNPFLITALIRQESAFNENARSKVGAVGLMQLMPRTARLFEKNLSRRKLLQPETNLKIGIRYFENLLDRFQGDVELALAAYNAGPEAVDRWRKRYPMNHRLLFLDLIPYSETRNYVTLIGRNYYWYSKLYEKDAKTIASNSMQLPVEFRSMNLNEK